MERILLVLSTTRQSDKAIDMALSMAEEQEADLMVLFILNSKVPDTVFDQLTDVGFMGERPSSESKATIVKEQRDRGLAKLKEIEKLAEDRGVFCQSWVVQGDFGRESVKMAAAHEVDLLIVCRARRPGLSRFFFDQEIEEVIRWADCEVRVVEEE